MSCNLATSITKAAVTDKELRKLLTPDVVENVALTYLKQHYFNLQVYVYDRSENYVALQVGPCQVVIMNGAVRVRSVNASLADDVSAQTEQLLVQLADSLFQQKVQQALGGLVTQAQTVTVDNDGTQQTAAVFTIEF